MKRWLTIVSVFCLAATAAQSQVRYPPDPVQCDCSDTVLIKADGGLNMRHCGATRVLATLDRLAERTAQLLPLRVEPVDLDLLTRKLERERREAVRALLKLMTWDDLGRFLPFVRNSEPPDLQAGVTYGTWAGASPFACGNAVYWINEGLERIEQVSTLLVNLQLETQMYPSNPSHFCGPADLSDSSYYQAGLARFGQAWSWLQAAADNMTDGNPQMAYISSHLAWWQAYQGTFYFLLAHSQQMGGDDRCTEVADAGLALAEVGAAAQQAFEQAEVCAGAM